MSEDLEVTLEPLQRMFEQVVVKDRQRIMKDYKRVKDNLTELLSIVSRREILEKRDRFVRLLLQTGEAVGDCLRMTAKIRYPHIVGSAAEIKTPSSRAEERSHNPSPIVIQTQPTQLQTGGVRGFLAGFWEYRIAKILAKAREKMPSEPVSTGTQVIDEVRALEEVRPLLNQLADLVFRCLRRYDRHPSKAIIDYLHWRAEQDLTKISLLLQAAARWSCKDEISESRRAGIALAAYAARVAEAQAQKPVFPAYMPRPLPEGFGPTLGTYGMGKPEEG